MRENNYKSILENENKVIYLESKLKNVLDTIEIVIDGKLEEAKDSLTN
jgi:hypothetical protein